MLLRWRASIFVIRDDTIVLDRPLLSSSGAAPGWSELASLSIFPSVPQCRHVLGRPQEGFLVDGRDERKASNGRLSRDPFLRRHVSSRIRAMALMWTRAQSISGNVDLREVIDVVR